MSAHWNAVALCMALCACSASEDPGSTNVARCNSQVCGSNSARIAFAEFHELNVRGLENAEGFAVDGITIGSDSFGIDVRAGRIIATSKRGNVSGSGLVDGLIWLTRGGKQRYVLKIASVGAVELATGAPDPVETYELLYSPVSNGVPLGEYVNVCSRASDPTYPDPAFPEEAAWETLGQDPGHALVFEGDRIDRETNAISQKLDRTWFNLACGGHALAKLALTRNVAIYQAAPKSQWAERQTTLRMLTADYCGDGTAFTVTGQRLTWFGGGMDLYWRPRVLEARWDIHGAICLDEPRMVKPTNELGKTEFPDVEAQIAAQCVRPPPCASADPYILDGALRVTASPDVPPSRMPHVP